MKGILFNYECGMFQAVIAGGKTQTRRAGAELAEINKDPGNWFLAGGAKPIASRASATGEILPIGANTSPKGIYFTFLHKHPVVINRYELIVPRYQPGEIVYLKEPIMDVEDSVYRKVFYKYPAPPNTGHAAQYHEMIAPHLKLGAKWQNKLFMGEKYARFYIKVKSVKAERLHDITRADILSEGIIWEWDDFYYINNGVKNLFPTDKEAYLSLYQAVGNKKADIEKNPWLFAYTIELVTKNGTPVKQ